jgi:methionyl-tRNA synthetase
MAFYVTTPIYYVNAEPHLGHAYTTIVADALARFHRLMGEETRFQTGTDEHGDKVLEASAKAGLSVQDFVDRISDTFRRTWDELGISYDVFVRTTQPSHVKVVQEILDRLYQQGDIYFGEYGGLYCFGCERFYLERELEDGQCPDHRKPPTFIKEENYFFRMSRYQEWLLGYIEDYPDWISPERYRNEVLGFLREPLEDLCISRPKQRLSWGIPLPFDDRYVSYVWFDALLNYLTGLGYPHGADYRKFWPEAHHLIAKDILKPHAIYWPTMLKAAGIEPFRQLHVHGYWQIAAGKMSKSLGNVVEPLALVEKYGIDQVRYFFLREMVYGLDATFSEEALRSRINADLANDLGNLFARSLGMAFKYRGGTVPAPQDLEALDREVAEQARETAADFLRLFPELEFPKALARVWELVGHLNRYIVATAPWELAKDPAGQPRLDTVLYHLLEGLRFLAVLLRPVMPASTRRMGHHLGLESSWQNRTFPELLQWGGLPPKALLSPSKALFPRLE